jgi:hypothetical protein
MMLSRRRRLRPLGAPGREACAPSLLTQLEQLGPHLGAVVTGIKPDQLDDPTPCANFTVRGVLEHMIAGATAFTAAYRSEQPAEPSAGASPLERLANYSGRR